MNLAFYYHIPITIKGDALYCPGYLGVFLDSIALEVDKLILIMHESESEEGSNYKLKQKNISFVSLGEKTPAWNRILFHKSILKFKLNSIKDCDVVLVRSPSPLAPYFKRYLKQTRLVYLVVGDYQESAKLMKMSSLRDLVVKGFLMFNNYLFLDQLKKNHTIVNSKTLFKKYEKNCNHINIIKTTTLSKKDFFKREDTCLDNKINLLYTGRIQWEKGLAELLNAFSEIRKTKNNLHLNIVGWEDDIKQPVETELKILSQKLNIEAFVTFHGFKRVGKELNEIYRMADIYILPSYHEGFPRTIWEAMANSLPVICTSVGSIPLELTNEQDALIVQPKKVQEIEKAINKLLTNSSTRRFLIKNGHIKASHNTLEIQTKKLIKLISHE
tara:strand:- start:6925 stop:8082 length:1158 start_codon:yes stop_codon:yes gene_type:complete